MPREPREDLIPIGLRIKAARENMGLSQQQVRMKLAEKGIEITQAGYSHWETGRADIAMSDLKVLADLLKVDAGYVLGQVKEDVWIREPAGQRYYGLDPAKRNLIDALMEQLADSDKEETTHGRKAE